MKRAALLGFLLLALLVGCGAETQPQPDTGAADDGTTDMSSSLPDTAAEGQFEPGWNIVSQNTPDSFTPLSDGEEIPFVFGVQGSWMVVLAFRTRDLFPDPFDVQAEITLDGVDSGDIWLADQETFPGGDEWDYYYNLFLPIDDQPPAQGSPVGIVVRVLDADGNTLVEREHAMLAGPAEGP